VPINKGLNNFLLLGISSCGGFNGIRMAIISDSVNPFFALVGPTETIPLADAAIAFVTFYHRLYNGAPILTALEAMRVASGCDKFAACGAEAFKKLWTTELQKLDPSQVSEKIGEQVK